MVEQINSAASLYSETILEHPIALLIKATVSSFRTPPPIVLYSVILEFFKWYFNRWEIDRNAFSLEFNGRNEAFPQIIIPTIFVIFAFEHKETKPTKRVREKYVR